jgi:hypothetical protein
MRLVEKILRTLWSHWIAALPAACCPGCCVNFAGFR